MRTMPFLCLSMAAALSGQSNQAVTYTYDVNGNRTAVSTSGSSNGSSIETIRSVNGSQVPLEKSEERIISEGPNSRIVERIVQTYSPDGRPAGKTKERIEETTQPGGATTVRTTVYDADLNGGFAVRERVTVQVNKAGDTTRAETVAERPTINGSFQTAERRTELTRGDEKASTRDVTVYRPNSDGRFVAAEREIAEVKTVNGLKTSNTTTYNTASTGKMELSTQKVSRSETLAGGVVREVVDVYGATAPGQAGTAGPQLREQQIIERKPQGQGFVETFSVRRPALDSSRLGAAQKISEKVCSGSCTGAAPKP